eukprot:scaffold189560_cov43-Prasinocladus_malaysianus.AAC.1
MNSGRCRILFRHLSFGKGRWSAVCTRVLLVRESYGGSDYGSDYFASAGQKSTAYALTLVRLRVLFRVFSPSSFPSRTSTVQAPGTNIFYLPYHSAYGILLRGTVLQA